MKLQYQKILPLNNNAIKNCVFFIHGLGDSPAGFASLFQQLQRSPSTSKVFANTLIVLPQALNLPLTANGGYVMPSWFDIISFEPHATRVYGLTQFSQSLSMINDLVNDIQKEYEIPNGKFIVGGFSQGAALSLSSNLILKDKLAGIVALSGFNVWESVSDPILQEYLKDLTENDKKIPVFQGTGDIDPLVSIPRAEEAKEWYTKVIGSLNEDSYTLKIYQGLEHSTDPEELMDMSNFIKKSFDL